MGGCKLGECKQIPLRRRHESFCLTIAFEALGDTRIRHGYSVRGEFCFVNCKRRKIEHVVFHDGLIQPTPSPNFCRATTTASMITPLPTPATTAVRYRPHLSNQKPNSLKFQVHSCDVLKYQGTTRETGSHEGKRCTVVPSWWLAQWMHCTHQRSWRHECGAGALRGGGMDVCPTISCGQSAENNTRRCWFVNVCPHHPHFTIAFPVLKSINCNCNSYSFSYSTSSYSTSSYEQDQDHHHAIRRHHDPCYLHDAHVTLAAKPLQNETRHLMGGWSNAPLSTTQSRS